MIDETTTGQPLRAWRTPAQLGRLFMTGMAMGAADVVPGVSGGTMAFILGIYQDLLNAIKSFNLDVLRALLRGQVRAALAMIPWRFLVVLGGGVGLALILLVQGIGWLLVNQTELLFAFFFGLVLASIVAVGAHLRWRWPVALALGAGTLLAWWVVGLIPVNMPHDPLTLFLSGAVAICAMILPGISGSFILLILGQYEYVLDQIRAFNLPPLIVFAAGCAVGLLAFARVLSWLLKRYQQLTIAVLTGFMVGSLRRIWPWKADSGLTIPDGHGGLEPLLVNALPLINSAFWWGLALIVLGFVLVSVLDHVSSGSNPLFRWAVRRPATPMAES